MPKSFLCFFCLVFFSTAQAQDKWDLQQCVTYALSHNISIQQQDIQARLSKLTYQQNKLSQYPSLNFTSNLGLSTGRNIDRTTNQYTTNSIFYNTFGLQTNVEIFNFYSKKNTIAASFFEAEADYASVDKLKNDVALNVAGAYLQILLNREQINITRLQLEQTKAQLANTRKLVQAGSVPELNATQLEAQLASDSSLVVSARGTERQSVLYLKALLGMDASFVFDIVTPPIELIPVESLADLQPETVYNLAYQNLPQQRVNQLRLQAAQKNAAAARGALYPSIGLGANIQTNYSNAKNNYTVLGYNTTGFQNIGVVKGTLDTVIAPILQPQLQTFSDPYGRQLRNNLGNGVGLSINVPIFNGGSARTNLQKAKLNVETYQLQQQQDNLTLKQDVYKAYNDAFTSQEKFNASTKSVEVSQKAYDFATKRYNIGLLNTLDLITTQNNLFRAKLERSLAQYDFVFKMKVLEFYKGQGLKL
jgi:outer membrane protein